MRPLFALILTLVLIGGISGYIRFANSVSRPPIEIQVNYSDRTYSVIVERSFDCAGDPIFGSDALKILFKGEKMLSKSGKLPADEEVTLKELDGVEIGENEIFVSANMAEPVALGVIKVTITRDDVVVAQELLTSEEGLLSVRGPVSFHVDEQKHAPGHIH